MKARSPLYYDFRLVFDLSGMLPLLGIPAFALLTWLLWGQQGMEAPLPPLYSFIFLLPLAAGFSAAHLMTIEHDEGFAELRRSYPEERFRLPLLRSAAALGFLLLAVLIGASSYRILWGPIDLLRVVLPGLPPALFLAGLSFCSGSITRSYWAAAGLTLAYWFLELQTRGQVSGPLGMFSIVWPLEGISLQVNQALLAGSGVFFHVINAALYSYRGGWRLRRPAIGM